MSAVRTAAHGGCKLAYRARGDGLPVLFIQGVNAHGDGGTSAGPAERRQAVGCLVIVLVVLLGPGAALAAGMGWEIATLVRVPFEGDARAVFITVNPDQLGRWAAAEVE